MIFDNSLNANAPDFNPTLSGVILLKPGEIITTSGRKKIKP